MKRSNLALSLAALLLPLSAAAADEPASKQSLLGDEASIPFPSESTIRNWRADRERGIWIEDRRGNWYYGRFAGICRDLEFSHAIGIDAPGAGRLDRFATVIVRGDRCALTSFVHAAPPTGVKAKKADDRSSQN